MRRQPLAAFLTFALLLAACTQNAHPQVPLSRQSIDVYFSPKGGCTNAIAKEIDGAKANILVQAYSFTSAPIAKALVNAHKRGVDVRVILDKSQRTQKYSSADFLQHAGIPTFIDDRHAIAHNKIMIIDGVIVITGSFNFTKSAEEKNAENLLVIWDQGIADKYTANWNKHLKHSERYEEKTRGYSEMQAAPPVADGYVASRSSQVFHQPDCKSATKISTRNLVRYNTRNEAVQAGKRPCHECNP